MVSQYSGWQMKNSRQLNVTEANLKYMHAIEHLAHSIDTRAKGMEYLKGRERTRKRIYKNIVQIRSNTPTLRTTNKTPFWVCITKKIWKWKWRENYKQQWKYVTKKYYHICYVNVMESLDSDSKVYTIMR